MPTSPSERWEANLAEIERVVDALENGKLSLLEAETAIETAITLLEACRTELTTQSDRTETRLDAMPDF